MLERQDGAKEEVVVAITTFEDRDLAGQFGATLVELQLVACVNLVSGIESIYRWKGKVERGTEVLLVMKTTRARLDELAAHIREHHPYDEPEFLILPVEAGLAGYLDWVRDSVAEE